MTNRNDDARSNKNEDQKNETYDKAFERQKEKRLVRKIVLSIVALLVLLLMIFGTVAYQYVTTSLEPLDPQSEEDIQVEIPSGSTSSDIARILEADSIINSASVFNFYVRMNNETGFQAGYYLLSPSMTLDEIIASLQEGGSDSAFDGSRILVQEGVTLEQIALSVADATDHTEDEFLEVVQNEDFLDDMLESYPELLASSFESEDTRYALEGYLFPATYDYSDDMTLESLIQSMISRTNDVMQNYYETIEERGMTVHEVLTLASFIEREGIQYDDRTHIAGVFFNRLEAGMPLQTDISVLYALNEHKEFVSYDDLAVDSPYNTYVHTGLGPGPVNSPGEESITAALNPIDTENFYFLADLETGNVYFSRTYEEHQELIEQYLD